MDEDFDVDALMAGWFTGRAAGEDFPVKLFKYLAPEYADSMLTKGCIKIGTNYYYKGLEHAGLRRDMDDGVKRTVVKDARIDHAGRVSDTKLRADENEVLDRVFGAAPLPSGASVIIKNTTVTQISSEMLYCMSEARADKRLIQEFGQACVEITNLPRFVVEITRVLVQGGITAHWPSIDRCVYDSSADGVPAWLLKRPHFARQREVRIGWSPTKSGPTDQIIYCPGICGLCRLAAKLP